VFLSSCLGQRRIQLGVEPQVQEVLTVQLIRSELHVFLHQGRVLVYSHIPTSRVRLALRLVLAFGEVGHLIFGPLVSLGHFTLGRHFGVDECCPNNLGQMEVSQLDDKGCNVSGQLEILVGLDKAVPI